MMLIIPAIDLKDGQVVRLKKGDFNTVQQVAEDPVETARQFYAAGARPSMGRGLGISTWWTWMGPGMVSAKTEILSRLWPRWD